MRRRTTSATPRVSACSTIITAPASFWSAERGEAEEPLWLLLVGRVVRLEAEHERKREELADPEQDCGDPDPRRHAQPPVARRVDQERPDESSDEDEREMLDPVDGGVLERCLVQRRDVPRDEDDEPERDRDARAEEERERRSEQAESRERREQVAREEEHRERATHREQRERDAEVGDQDVLEHVRRLEVLLGDRVERRDDPEHDDRDTRAEQRDAGPRRERRRRRRRRFQPLRKKATEIAARTSTSGSSAHAVQRSSRAVAPIAVTGPRTVCPRGIADPAAPSARRVGNRGGRRARGRCRGPGCGRGAPGRAPRRRSPRSQSAARARRRG